MERAKRRAAGRVLEAVEPGMILGLGSGTTAAHAIRGLGERVEAGLDVVGVPTSHQAALVAREAGVPTRCLSDVERIDVAIDGADQVAGLDLIKGGGGAHTREKIVDAAADRFLVLVDETKLADTLDLPVPVEVFPAARRHVEDAIEAMGGAPALRVEDGDLGPALTDDGNVIVDCAFGVLDDPERVAAELSSIPGVVDHGLFLDLADAVYVGTAESVDVVR